MVYCDPFVSSPNALEIKVMVSDPSGVSSVAIRYWLVNKKTAAVSLKPTSEVMKLLAASGAHSDWYIFISLENTVVEDTPMDYWFQFQFVATDNAGANTQSVKYRDQVTYRSCEIFR